MAINDTLTERGSRYGNYQEQCMISADLKYVIHDAAERRELDLREDQQDALDMIAVKISRILNGDPDYSDNWHDIAGYATLVADRLDGNERK